VRGPRLAVTVASSTICAEYADGSITRGEVEVDAAQIKGRGIQRVWLEPRARDSPAVADAIRGFDAVIIGPGSFYTSIMPPLLVSGVADALASVSGPIILIATC
jgi:uncharacterized cofD-like protein